MSSLMMIAAIIAALLLPSSGAPQLRRLYRYRREAPQPYENSREATETAEDVIEGSETVQQDEAITPPEETPESSRRGRQLNGDFFGSFARTEDQAETSESTEPKRNEKSIAFYDYLRPPYFDMENEVLSRTNPDRGDYPDSPIYYIRLPPTPYMFVPGLGYVSPPPQTPTMSPFINLPLDFVSNGKPNNIYHWSTPNNGFQKPVSKPDLNFVSNGKPTSIYRPQADKFGNPSYRPTYRPKPEINLDFVSNGKPTNVYRPEFDSQEPESIMDFVSNGKPTNVFRPSFEDAVSPGDSTIYRPIFDTPRPQKPNTNVVNMNKGPYVFNGRPSDIFLLRNSYNALYEDALQNFYP